MLDFVSKTLSQFNYLLIETQTNQFVTLYKYLMDIEKSKFVQPVLQVQEL